jgi:uncharacterized protein
VRDFLRKLSDRVEFAVVAIGACGIFVPANLIALIDSQRVVSRASPPISTHALGVLLIYEVIALIVLGGFLRLRGWTLARLGLQWTARDYLVGIGLMFASYAAYLLVVWGANAVWPETIQQAGRTSLVAPRIPVVMILAVAIVNPVFEELFVCGYFVSVLKKWLGPTMAVNVSVACRVFYHSYQGIRGVLAATPIGLVYATWYSRTGRLWPVIVAHAIMDLVGLALGSGAHR